MFNDQSILTLFVILLILLTFLLIIINNAARKLMLITVRSYRVDVLFRLPLLLKKPATISMLNISIRYVTCTNAKQSRLQETLRSANKNENLLVILDAYLLTVALLYPFRCEHQQRPSCFGKCY